MSGRVLQTDASLWKEEKTLSYSKTFFKQWDSIWTGRLSNNSLPTYAIVPASCLEDFIECKVVLYYGLSSQMQTNAIHLDTITDIYPHLDRWDGTNHHATILLATLLRYRRIYSEDLTFTSTICIRTPPLPLIYITEYNETFEKNCANPLIDKIILLNAPVAAAVAINKEKVELRISQGILTYADIFTIILSLSKCLVVFSTPGIFLDDWKDLWTVNLKKTMLALLPCEVPASGNLDNPEILPISDSQHTWVVRSEDIANLTDLNGLDIPITYLKSDSVFAYRMLQKKFLIVNPARSLITWVGKRETGKEKEKHMIHSPIYHHIHPTGINDMKPVLMLEQKKETISRTVEGPFATRWLHKLCLPIPLGESEYFHTSPTILEIKNCFQTMSGLAFDSENMYIGNGSKAQEAWSSETLYALCPTESYEFGYIVPMPVIEEREKYILYVISKLLQLQKRQPGGFHVCQDSTTAEFFKLTNRIPYTPDTHIFYKKALCFPFDVDLSPSNIVALRESVGWNPEIAPKVSLVFMDPSPHIETLRRGWDVYVYTHTMSIQEIVTMFSGAWGVVCKSNIESYGWNWLLPKGARVLELSSTSTHAHTLSTVSGLRHILTTNEKLLNNIADY